MGALVLKYLLLPTTIVMRYKFVRVGYTDMHNITYNKCYKIFELVDCYPNVVYRKPNIVCIVLFSYV